MATRILPSLRRFAPAHVFAGVPFVLLPFLPLLAISMLLLRDPGGAGPRCRCQRGKSMPIRKSSVRGWPGPPDEGVGRAWSALPRLGEDVEDSLDGCDRCDEGDQRQAAREGGSGGSRDKRIPTAWTARQHGFGDVATEGCRCEQAKGKDHDPDLARRDADVHQ